MDKQQLFEYQNKIFRNPFEIAGALLPDKKALHQSLLFNYDQGSLEILSKLNAKIFISREYEHLVICLSAENLTIKQTFFPIAHPSGLAVDHDKLYVASTRNPNQIVEFCPTTGFMERIEDHTNPKENGILLPSRTKYYSGASYFHDLAFIGKQLYGTAVGLNGILPINFDFAFQEKIIWKPDFSEIDNLKLSKGNYLQINSIAAGNNLKESFFSASAAQPGKFRPGSTKFPVDKKGVLFAGTGQVIATGLTRPHSARLYQEKLWLNNSGYGSFGTIQHGIYIPILKLPGWTRGLHFIDNFAFIGVSRILPRFEQYAPGIESRKSKSAIYIIDLTTMKIAGQIDFPNGNQIFGIESIKSSNVNGFFNSTILNKPKSLKSIFYKFKNQE